MSLGIILAPYGKIPGAYPSAINYSYGGDGQYLCPEDPQFNERDQQGMYFDTMLGGGMGKARFVSRRVRGADGRVYTQRVGIDGTQHSLAGLSWWQRHKLRQYYKNLTVQANADRVSSPFLGAIPTDAELSTVYQYTPVTSGWVAAKEAFFPSPWLPPNGWNQAGAYGPQPQLRGVGETSPDDVIASLNAHNQRVFALTMVSTAAVAISALLGAFRTIKALRETK